MIDADTIAKLRELEARATRGPWDVDTLMFQEIGPWDAELTAAMRNALPGLLDEIERLRVEMAAKMAAWEEACRAWRGEYEERTETSRETSTETSSDLPGAAGAAE